LAVYRGILRWLRRWRNLSEAACCDSADFRFLPRRWPVRPRDSKVLDIFEGTQQIPQLIVARQVLGKSSRELR